jgi:hypothetical protein
MGIGLGSRGLNQADSSKDKVKHVAAKILRKVSGGQKDVSSLGVWGTAVSWRND